MANIKPQKEMVRQRCDWPTEGEAWVWDCHERKPKARRASGVRKGDTKPVPKPKAGGAPS